MFAFSKKNKESIIELSYTYDGKNLGIASSIPTTTSLFLVLAMSCDKGEILQVRLQKESMSYWPTITDDTGNTTTIMDVRTFLSLKNKDDDDVSWTSPKVNQQQYSDTAFIEKTSVENKSSQEDNNLDTATSLTANNTTDSNKEEKHKDDDSNNKKLNSSSTNNSNEEKHKNSASAAFDLDTIPSIDKLMEYGLETLKIEFTAEGYVIVPNDCLPSNTYSIKPIILLIY